MTSSHKKIFLLLIVILSSVNNLFSQNNGDREYIYLTAEEVTDRIRGGLLGQMLGNLNGIPHEFKYFDEPGNVTNYIPSLPDGAWTDDDTDFEWVYILEMQKKRNPLLSGDEIFSLWKERINRRIWCSNRFARYLMDIGIKPPFTGYSALNPWADFNISGQFLCETFGLISPGMPQTAAKTGLNYTTTAINNEPAQATQFFTAMISYAFIEEDIRDIINAGMSALDSKSKLNGISRDVLEWYSQYPLNWKETRRLLKEKYTLEGGNIRDNNGFELNTGSIIAALLYGDGDFQESLKIAFNFGWDADCNAATVGTILGVRYGYRKMMNHNDPHVPEWLIADRYKNTTRDNMPTDETITSFADRLIELFEIINGNNGGGTMISGEKLTYKIPIEDPVPVIRLSSFPEQKKILLENSGNQVEMLLVSKDGEERARTAYLAICLDLNKSLADQYPKEWKQACYELSGYWKIMNNIFESKDSKNEFRALKALRTKFEAAGFKAPIRSYEDEELYNDLNTWRKPESDY